MTYLYSSPPSFSIAHDTDLAYHRTARPPSRPYAPSLQPQ